MRCIYLRRLCAERPCIDLRQGAWSSAVIEISIIFLFVLGFAFFLVWWAHEAERDRSAMVGLYLILGAPGLPALHRRSGRIYAPGGGRHRANAALRRTWASLPLYRPIRALLARIGDFDPDDPVHFLGSGMFLGSVGFLGGQLVPRRSPPTSLVSRSARSLFRGSSSSRWRSSRSDTRSTEHCPWRSRA